MHARAQYLFAMALTLPLASCHFVGGKLDMSIWQDAFTPAQADSVCVESPVSASYPAEPQITPVASTPAPRTLPPAAPPQPAAPARPAGTCTVARGDTLSGIACRYGVSTASLAAANGIDLNTPLIRTGQRLIIPGRQNAAPARRSHHFWEQPQPTPRQARPTPSRNAPHTQQQPRTATQLPGTGRPYRIESGDTLHHIARKHGVSLQALMKANNLTPESADKLRAGSTIIIPPQPRL